MYIDSFSTIRNGNNELKEMMTPTFPDLDDIDEKFFFRPKTRFLSVAGNSSSKNLSNLVQMSEVFCERSERFGPVSLKPFCEKDAWL